MANMGSRRRTTSRRCLLHHLLHLGVVQGRRHRHPWKAAGPPDRVLHLANADATAGEDGQVDDVGLVIIDEVVIGMSEVWQPEADAFNTSIHGRDELPYAPRTHEHPLRGDEDEHLGLAGDDVKEPIQIHQVVCVDEHLSGYGPRPVQLHFEEPREATSCSLMVAHEVIEALPAVATAALVQTPDATDWQQQKDDDAQTHCYLGQRLSDHIDEEGSNAEDEQDHRREK
mmetsp:Transcript_102542/g.267611  ORF Transcript_102542/g.267611 Transcript_102542/m.267611 type:complete len:228 (+) Transcript_102542:1183-1866(+)